MQRMEADMELLLQVGGLLWVAAVGEGGPVTQREGGPVPLVC
jgi:hypothetical protein